jgi:hypothetical protein
MRIHQGCKTSFLILFCSLQMMMMMLALSDGKRDDRFFRAEPANGKIEIWADDLVDWKSLAPPGYKWTSYRNPPRSLQKLLRERRNPDEVAYLDFDLPLPGNFKKGVYYLISSDGITPLTLESLHGFVRYQFRSSEELAAIPTDYYGRIVARVGENKTPRDGFALYSEKPLSFKFKVVQINVSDYPSLLEQSHEQIMRRVQEGREKWGIAHSFGFQFNSNKELFAFVEWDLGKEEACSFNASILDLGRLPREIIWHASWCDF